MAEKDSENGNNCQKCKKWHKRGTKWTNFKHVTETIWGNDLG